MQKSPIKAHSGIFSLRSLFGKIPAAAIIYLVFGIYLYLPYFKHFKVMQYMILLNAVIGALGCFVLSQRWIGAFAGELFAGIIYGFSPFAFGFAAYHPLAGLPFAILPWLFCPAVYWSKISKYIGFGQHQESVWSTITTSVLSFLPFILIAMFFWLFAKPKAGNFFPLPVQEKLHLTNIAGLMAPLAFKPHKFIFGFYHLPLITGLMGLFIYYKGGRIRIMIIIAAGLLLSLFNPVFQVPPIVWASIPVLYCSVLIGLGMQGLALSGKADTKWILVCIITSAALAVMMILLSSKPESPYHLTAQMHALAAALIGITLLIVKSGLRLHWLRWSLLCIGLGFDIFVGARYLVDKIF